MKKVGHRRTSDELIATSPPECFDRALRLQEQAELLNPFPRPRGFVFKAKTRAEYVRWRLSQSNPRLW